MSSTSRRGPARSLRNGIRCFFKQPKQSPAGRASRRGQVCCTTGKSRSGGLERLFYRFLLEMAAELEAHRGEHLVLEIRLAARTESRIERRRQDRRGDGFVDRRFDRPASFARIGDVRSE